MDYECYNDQDFTDANKSGYESTIYTNSAAQQLRREIHNRVQAIMCTLSDGVVSRILHFYRWREDLVIELFLKDAEQLLKIVRIPQAKLVSLCDKIPLPDQIVCSYCYAETNDFDHPGCGHFFCRPCWRNYLKTQLERVPSRELSCIADKCSHPFSESFVSALGLSSETVQLFQKYLYTRFIRANNRLSPCQAAGCTNVIENPIREGEALVCICSCGHRFCPRCPAGYHSPLSCDSLKANTFQREEFQQWVMNQRMEVRRCSFCYQQNTRPVDLSIHHKKCESCGSFFCWICNGEWSDLAPHMNCLESADELTKTWDYMQRCSFSFDWDVMPEKDLNKHKCDIIRRADQLNINFDIEFLQQIYSELVNGRAFLVHYTIWLESNCTEAEKDLHSLRRDSYASILKVLNDSFLRFLAVPSEQAFDRMRPQMQTLPTLRQSFL